MTRRGRILRGGMPVVLEDAVTIVDRIEQREARFQLCCDRESVLETRRQRELFEFLGASDQLEGTQWTN